MTTLPPSVSPTTEAALPRRRTGFAARFLRYALSRAVSLSLMLVVGVFTAVVVLNFGGYIDQIHRANIDDAIMFMNYNAQYSDTSPAELRQMAAGLRAEMERAYGLDQPFLLRCVRWTYEALTLNIGDRDGGSGLVFRLPSETIRMIFLNRLPFTLLLFGVSNLLFFFASFAMALFLFRRYDSFLDRLFIFLSPLSSLPNWVFGMFLVILFSAVFKVLPFPRQLTMGLSEYVSHNPFYFLKYMILPVSAIFLSMFFQGVYTWRTFFLLQAGEDYIELARAKGLPDKLLQRRYLVRTSLPYIVTSFAMTMLGVWQAAFVLEKFFFWPGIGSLFFDSLTTFPVTGGIIVLFAYLLAITVFLLDLLCALVDPRLQAGGERGTQAGAAKRSPGRRLRFALTAVRQARSLPRQLLAGSYRPDRGAMRRYRSRALAGALAQLRRYPAALVGLAIIGLLIVVSVYTVIAYPYTETILRWRGDGGVWENNPELAQPAWINFFRREKLPETIVLDSRQGAASRQIEDAGGGMRRITLTFPFEYVWGGYPQDLVVNIDSRYAEKAPYLSLTWITPDGRELPLDTFIGSSESRYSFDWNYYYERQNLLTTVSGPLPWGRLFGASSGGAEGAVQGTYRVRLEGYVYEEGADIEAEVVLYGQVYGLAGTDADGRDLLLAVLWGTPFSLAFGLLGAFGTGLLAMGMAAAGVWFGGPVDWFIQRLTEINMLLPAMPIAIMVYFLYTHNIWVILGVIILLGVFGNALKNYRAAFLQYRDAGYIQAAQVYGAGNARLILRYFVPRIIPLLVPQLVALVPSYIFLEPTLAFVGVADPHLPTWGKVLMTGLYMAQDNSQIFYLNLMRNPYLALEPLGLMFVTGLAFSLLGVAFDRIFNPRLRSL